MSGNKRLGITVQLDRRGYCPGENIIVSVKVSFNTIKYKLPNLFTN